MFGEEAVTRKSAKMIRALRAVGVILMFVSMIHVVTPWLRGAEFKWVFPFGMLSGWLLFGLSLWMDRQRSEP
jgi:hypothetical protein